MKFENMNSDKFKAFENNQVAMDNVIGGTRALMSRKSRMVDSAELCENGSGKIWDEQEWHASDSLQNDGRYTWANNDLG
ncbi:MAG: hypothetical protein ACPGXZ_03720 [Saprospiraceae bacterium]